MIVSWIIIRGMPEEIASEEVIMAAFEAGLQWGRVKRMTHPKMQPFIFTSKGEIQVIDLAKSIEMLDNALEFVKGVVRSGGIILIVGIQPAARELTAEYSKRLKFPYVTDRWLGGTITNFQTLISRIQYLQSLEEKIQSPDFASYTKKERINIQREADELKKKFEGLRGLSRLPDAVFVLGAKRHALALREAKHRKISTIALVNTDDDPMHIDWPIPGNDSASTAIKFILDRFAEAVESARQSVSKKEEAESKVESAEEKPSGN